jgi:hypothetical protein
VDDHEFDEFRKARKDRLRRASLALFVVLVEICQIPLFEAAFGAEFIALLSVRLLLTFVLCAFLIRGNNIARILLGAVRAMAFMVAIVMSIQAEAWALAYVSILDAVAAVLLFRMRLQ